MGTDHYCGRDDSQPREMEIARSGARRNLPAKGVAKSRVERRSVYIRRRLHLTIASDSRETVFWFADGEVAGAFGFTIGLRDFDQQPPLRRSDAPDRGVDAAFVAVGERSKTIAQISARGTSYSIH